MGQLEQNFKTASMELVQIRNQKGELERDNEEHAQMSQQLEQEV